MAKCPECGERIGGAHHQMINSNRRLGGVKNNSLQDKNVRFAELNNCIHCFHKHPLLLKKQSEIHIHKMNWAANQEGGKNGFWRSDVTYRQIIDYNPQLEIDFIDFSECDYGMCEL